MPLAPEYDAMLKEMAAAEGPAITDMTPEESRGLYSMMRPADGSIDVGSVSNRNVPGPAGDIPVRIYQPAGDGPRGTVVYFHGGGWVIGDLDCADTVCRALCAGSDCTVVSVDYRLAPEHPYPAAADDAWAATVWVADNLDELGSNGRIAVTGESAGGNLAAVVANKARDAGDPAIALQLLLYPVVDADLSRGSYTSNGEGYVLETATMRWFWDHYCPAEQRNEPDASPIQNASLAGVAPAVIMTAEFDPLRDEGQAYAEALIAAGVEAELQCYDGLVHDFMAMAHAFPSCAVPMQKACATLREALG